MIRLIHKIRVPFIIVKKEEIILLLQRHPKNVMSRNMYAVQFD